MKTKYSYTPLSIIAVVANAILFIGCFMIYSPINRLYRVASSNDYSSMMGSVMGSVNSIATGSKLLAFGSLATIVMAVFLIVYYIYEERKTIIAIEFGINIVEALLIFSVANSAISMVSSLFYSLDIITGSVVGIFKLLLFLSLLGFIAHLIILLQLLGHVYVPALAAYMPTRTNNLMENANAKANDSQIEPKATNPIHTSEKQEEAEVNEEDVSGEVLKETKAKQDKIVEIVEETLAVISASEETKETSDGEGVE